MKSKKMDKTASRKRKARLVLVCEVPVDQKRKFERHKKRKEHDKVARDGGVGEPANHGFVSAVENVWRCCWFVLTDDCLGQGNAGVELEDHSEKSHPLNFWLFCENFNRQKIIEIFFIILTVKK